MTYYLSPHALQFINQCPHFAMGVSTVFLLFLHCHNQFHMAESLKDEVIQLVHKFSVSIEPIEFSEGPANDPYPDPGEITA